MSTTIPATAIASPIEQLAESARELMRGKDAVLLRACEGCGSAKPREDELYCPNCGWHKGLIAIHIQRVRL